MDKIKVTNRYFILIIGGIGSLHDDESTYLYEHINPNDEQAVKEVIKKYIPECFESYSRHKHDALKIDLSYYLTITKHQTPKQYPYFEYEYENVEPSFAPPDDPRDFYVWTWEVLFPGEDYHIKNLDDYEEDHTPRGEPFEYHVHSGDGD